MRRALSEPVIYDKAKWHYEDDFPAGLRPEQAMVHTGFFLAWCVDRGLVSDAVPLSEVAALRERTSTGAELYAAMDGAFTSDCMSAEGNRFAQAYYASDHYLRDCNELLATNLPTLYHVDNTWENYDVIAARIDERYRDWRATSGRSRRVDHSVMRRLRRLRALAKKNDVDVEHLLAFAVLGDRAAVAPLQELKKQFEWHQLGRIPGSTDRYAPLGRWVDYVCAYLDGGCERIVALALDREEQDVLREDGLSPGSYALGLLEELRTPESVAALLHIGAHGSEALALRCAGALNTLLGGKIRVALAPPQGDAVRVFLHGLLDRKLVEPSVYLALREVGNAESIARIEQRRLADPLYEDVPKLVVKRIKQRLRE